MGAELQYYWRYFRNSSFLLILVFLTLWPGHVASSRGDRDKTFHSCLIGCKKFCNSSSNKIEFLNRQPIYLKYLNWDCFEECKYECMWGTVDAIQKRGLPTPQFYGKWPFTRILGFQEPASVLASFLNLYVHFRGILALRKSVPASAPLYWFWHVFVAFWMNGWIWSIVFHTRDTPFTEKMDYLSATMMVAFSFFAGCVRYFEKVGTWPIITIGSAITSYVIYHVYYLTFVNFDYGFNMRANIVLGVLNAGLWLIWSLGTRKIHPHSWKCALFITLAFSSIYLEVNDFPPIFWMVDAHALWHFITAPITCIWYSFLVDDVRYLNKKSHFL